MATSSSDLVSELKKAAQQKLVTSFLGTGIVGRTVAKRIADKNKDRNNPISKAMSEQNAVQNQVNSTAVKIEPIVRSIARTVNMLARVWAKHVYAKQEALRLQRERLTKERALAEEDENERRQAEQQAVTKESISGTQTEEGKGIIGSILGYTKSTRSLMFKAFKELGALLLKVGIGGAAAAYAMSVANAQDEGNQPPQPAETQSSPAPGAQLQSAAPVTGQVPQESTPPAPSSNPPGFVETPRGADYNVFPGATPVASASTMPPAPDVRPGAIGAGSLPDNPAKYLKPNPPLDASGKPIPFTPGPQPSTPSSANLLSPAPTPVPQAVPGHHQWPPKPSTSNAAPASVVSQPQLSSNVDNTQGTTETATNEPNPTDMRLAGGTQTPPMMSAMPSAAPPPTTMAAAPQPEQGMQAARQPSMPPSIQQFVSQVQQSTRSTTSPPSTADNMGRLGASLAGIPTSTSGNDVTGGMSGVPQSSPSTFGGLSGIIGSSASSGNQLSSLSTLIDSLVEKGIQSIAPIFNSSPTTNADLMGGGTSPLLPSPVANRGSLDIGTTFDAHA